MSTPADEGEEFCDSFFQHPALSFAAQPALKELFELVARSGNRTTLFLGAGVSLDSGLPTWSNLIANIGNLIKNQRWRDAAAADTTDPLRRAESFLQLACESGVATPEEIVREALYPQDFTPTPGRLADAVAGLTSWLGDAVDVVTTNFDTLMEQAMGSWSPAGAIDVRPVTVEETLDNPEIWQSGSTVLHLHGVLRPNLPPLGTVVLTESSFLHAGPRVRELVKQQLKETHVVFVGVSLTDPNLVGPLWDLKNSGEEYLKPFVIAVATAEISLPDPAEARAYFIKKASYLDSVLNVQTVFLKSYGQLHQLFYELSLAAAFPEQVLDDNDPTTSYRYGHRFNRALKSCYDTAGSTGPTSTAVGKGARNLSDRLSQALKDEISPLLVSYRDRLKRSTMATTREIALTHASDFDAENFGLFLWLRTRTRDNYASYDLRLIGTSTYVHREAWSIDRGAVIDSRSRHGAGTAAFYGRTELSDFPEQGKWQLWRSMLAVPFSVFDPANNLANEYYLGALDVGVITLNSTHRSVGAKGEGWNHRRSILSALTVAERQKLAKLLANIGRNLVS